MPTKTLVPRSGAGRIGFATLLTTSIFVFLARNPIWLVDSVALVPPVSECVLTPESAWQVPLSGRTEGALLSAVSYPIYVGIASFVITLLVLQLTQGVNLVTMLGVTSLSLLMRPIDLLSVACLLVFSRLWHSNSFRFQLVRWILAGICLCAAPLFSLDFGCIFLICILFVLLNHQEKLTTKLLAVSTLIAAATTTGCLVAGFFPALLRPFSWLWTPIPLEILPHLASPLHSVTTGIGLLLFGSMLVLVSGSKARHSIGIWRITGLFPLSLLALGNAYFTGLACCGMMTVLPNIVIQDLPTVQYRHLGKAGIVLVCCFTIWTTDKLSLLAGQATPRLVEVQTWQISGNVLLMQLDQAAAWQASKVRQQFRLVLDDRWDLYGQYYREYSSVCRDLREVRVNSYLKANGEWGGYTLLIRRWQVSLLEIKSQELDAIRRLSTSPDWKVMGIDSQRTLFGLQNVAVNVRQQRLAIKALMYLEWPNGSPPVNLAGAIVANTDEDARAVADVLVSIRFPYAALRLIENDFTAAAEHLRTMCYYSLAHRVHRHSGQVFLIHQFRALARLREEIDSGESSQDEVQKLTHALLHFINDSGVGGQVRTGGEPSNLSQSDPVSLIRQQLSQGAAGPAKALLDDIPVDVRPLYRLVIDSAHQSPATSFAELDKLLGHSPEIPKETLGEFFFYQGCYALEAGEPLAALMAFRRSQEVDPNSPFRPMRQFHLSQMTRPDNL